MKALLLRVGIDTSSDGTLSPLFADGTFEYIPLSETNPKSWEDKTYKNVRGRYGRYLSDYVPSGIASRKLHLDPEFETFTYGDETIRRSYLLKLEKDDLLVFYAGLKPFKIKTEDMGLYIIGYFTVKDVYDFSKLDKNEILSILPSLSQNPHLKTAYDPSKLVIIKGDPGNSRLLDKAIRISSPKKNRIGRTYHAISGEMGEELGIKGSIQRSIPPRFIEEEKMDNLKRLLGI